MSVGKLSTTINYYEQEFLKLEIENLEKMKETISKFPPAHQLTLQDEKKVADFKRKARLLENKINQQKFIFEWTRFYSSREPGMIRDQEKLRSIIAEMSKVQEAGVLKALETDKPSIRLMATQVNKIIAVFKNLFTFERSLTLTGAKLEWLENHLRELSEHGESKEKFWSKSILSIICTIKKT